MTRLWELKTDTVKMLICVSGIHVLDLDSMLHFFYWLCRRQTCWVFRNIDCGFNSFFNDRRNYSSVDECDISKSTEGKKTAVKKGTSVWWYKYLLSVPLWAVEMNSIPLWITSYSVTNDAQMKLFNKVLLICWEVKDSRTGETCNSACCPHRLYINNGHILQGLSRWKVKLLQNLHSF